MISTIDLCFILLTYKGKILLLQQEDALDAPTTNEWHFIKKIKAKNSSPEVAILQEVQRETRLKLEEVTLLSKKICEGTVQYLFHTKLTDKHVNNITRGEGRVLQFFGVNEVNKLHVQPSTKTFFSDNRAFLKNLSSA